MKARIISIVMVLVALVHGAAAAAPDGPMLPVTTPPIVYTINYSDAYFTDPTYIDRFRAAPHDLLHVGKAVPISHHWGPTRMYKGENQWTGGPGGTLSWENIALITPEQLAQRIEHIRHTVRQYHAIGVRQIMPYISYHTLAGDHQQRLGFWKFYDQWNTYEKWAGPKPPHDPFDWLVVDRQGKFVGGSCGGYSPDYYAPLHRYRACIRHPDWVEWQRRLVRMVAEAGYDGCFVDNATAPDDCYCRYCKQALPKFLQANRKVDWVRRLTEGLSADRLALDSPDVPAELVRRFRLLHLRDHLAMLRAAGREVNPRFAIFPNGNSIDECLITGAQSDLLMFESSYSPGILTAGEPPESPAVAVKATAQPVTAGRVTHRLDLDDAAHAIEMQVEVSLPTAVEVGRPASLEVKVISVGASTRDNDAAEEFFLQIGGKDRGQAARVELTPPAILGSSSPHGKGTRPPAVLTATWVPEHPGEYPLSLGFTYTDSPHVRLHRQVAPLALGKVCRTHTASQLFAQHMAARQIFLGYEATRKGFENVQELALAEMAAFSGGGGFSGTGEPQVKYRAFFQKHPELFAGWQMTAPAAVLYSAWGRNPLGYIRVVTRPTIQEYLAETHRPYVALIDATLPETAAPLTAYGTIYLDSPGYDATGPQLAALRQYVAKGGRIVLADAKITLNGKPVQDVFGVGASIWDWKRPAVVSDPIAISSGRQKNLRFALYHRDDRLALHAVNYHVCLLDPGKKILDVGPTELRLPLPPGWSDVTATCFDPDAPPELIPCRVQGGAALLTLPKVHIYRVVILEVRRIAGVPAVGVSPVGVPPLGSP